MTEARPGPLNVTAPPTAGLARPARQAAAGAGSAVLLGAVTMAVALVAAPGPWTRGYVSEAGTADMPQAFAYRWGLLALAVGVALLGAALVPVARPAAALLAVSGGLAGVTAAVPCSQGCPLPPYEVATAADLLHTGASILGMAACAGAMVALAMAPATPSALRCLSAGAAMLTFPIGVVEGLGMLVVGRGPFTAQVERLLLIVVVGWLISVAAATARQPTLMAPRLSGEAVRAHRVAAGSTDDSAQPPR